jgi:hypothetical protein
MAGEERTDGATVAALPPAVQRAVKDDNVEELASLERGWMRDEGLMLGLSLAARTGAENCVGFLLTIPGVVRGAKGVWVWRRGRGEAGWGEGVRRIRMQGGRGRPRCAWRRRTGTCAW